MVCVRVRAHVCLCVRCVRVRVRVPAAHVQPLVLAHVVRPGMEASPVGPYVGGRAGAWASGGVEGCSWSSLPPTSSPGRRHCRPRRRRSSPSPRRRAPPRRGRKGRAVFWRSPARARSWRGTRRRRNRPRCTCSCRPRRRAAWRAGPRDRTASPPSPSAGAKTPQPGHNLDTCGFRIFRCGRSNNGRWLRHCTLEVYQLNEPPSSIAGKHLEKKIAYLDTYPHER